MAEVTERDREAANRLFFLCGSLGDFDAACAFLAEWREARLAETESDTRRALIRIVTDPNPPAELLAYRESCVAEATTVCVKNWNEQTCRFWIALIEGQLRSIGCKPDIDNETLAAQMARDERDRERAAREKAEGERDEADRASAAFQRAKLAAEARLRDLVEAADRLLQAGDEMVARLESLEPHEVCCYSLEKACNAYCRIRDAQASPEPEASKQDEDEAHAEKLSIALGTICAYCGQPKTSIAPIWCVRQHGGRDGK